MQGLTPAFKYTTSTARKHARAGAATAFGLLVGMDATTPDGRPLEGEPAADAFMRTQAGAALGVYIGHYLVQHLLGGGVYDAADLGRVVTDYLCELGADMTQALL